MLFSVIFVFLKYKIENEFFFVMLRKPIAVEFEKIFSRFQRIAKVAHWLSCVCKFDNLSLSALTPIKTIFSGFNAPLDSTFIKNLFGFASQSNFASNSSSSSSECSLLGQSFGCGNRVCRAALSGSYSKQTPAVKS